MFQKDPDGKVPKGHLSFPLQNLFVSELSIFTDLSCITASSRKRTQKCNERGGLNICNAVKVLEVVIKQNS